MKLVKQENNEQLLISCSMHEIRALSALGTEILMGSITVSDNQWDAAILPVSKDEAQVIFDDLHKILSDTK